MATFLDQWLQVRGTLVWTSTTLGGSRLGGGRIEGALFLWVITYKANDATLPHFPLPYYHESNHIVWLIETRPVGCVIISDLLVKIWIIIGPTSYFRHIACSPLQCRQLFLYPFWMFACHNYYSTCTQLRRSGISWPWLLDVREASGEEYEKEDEVYICAFRWWSAHLCLQVVFPCLQTPPWGSVRPAYGQHSSVTNSFPLVHPLVDSSVQHCLAPQTHVKVTSRTGTAPHAAACGWCLWLGLYFHKQRYPPCLGCPRLPYNECRWVRWGKISW